MQVVVTGIGLRSALGTLKTTWQNLISSQSGIEFRQPFLELEPQPLALIGTKPANLTQLTQAVVCDAVVDANLTLPLPECGVVIGSSRGYQAQWEEWMRQPSKGGGLLIPNFFHHMAAINTAHQLGSMGPVLAPMAACATGLWALAQAYELIHSGQCQQVIAGAVETPITPLTLAGFRQMGALASQGAYPFDRNRDGLVLGEGGAVFVLESAECAQRRSAPIYGKILGFGLTADACSTNRPNLDGKSARTAIKDCLHRSHLSPQNINFIHAHGTATRLNDQHEADLIQTLFPPDVPVSSTKGATGHTLGASGAFGVAFCLLALQNQILPPCVGLKSLEFDLNVLQKKSETSVKNVLCLSFGFGGQNVAIALGQSLV